jgi:hypothetical protein
MKKINPYTTFLLVVEKKLSILERTSRFVIVIFLMTACEDFTEVEVGKSKITKDVVFSSDITATSAIIGIYSDMYNGPTSFANGTPYGAAALSGLSSDELYYHPAGPDFNSFEQNVLMPENQHVLSLWKSLYYSIYGANSAKEGIESSQTLTNATKDQLLGETFFVRAFCHFYLVNLFGEVPIVISTDFRVNAKISRSPISDVYDQIVEDLLQAQKLLKDDYPTTDRLRPNKQTATALLARAFLYMEEWEYARIQATSLISDARYGLEQNLDDVFLKSSREAIWQLMPRGEFKNTNEGNIFILNGPPTDSSHPFYLTNELVNSFEAGDARNAKWLKSISAGTTYYYSNKYKIPSGGTFSTPPVPVTEYSMVFRLAELYLIRAEAFAQLDQLSAAIVDVDVVRKRAGLPLLQNTSPGISKPDLLLAIERERRAELFTEWGHRWLDLKRTERADPVLAAKPNWDSNDQLYPIPLDEINKNPRLQ